MVPRGEMINAGLGSISFWTNAIFWRNQTFVARQKTRTMEPFEGEQSCHQVTDVTSENPSVEYDSLKYRTF